MTTTPPVGLKPCPFCRSATVECRNGNESWWVSCIPCGADGPILRSEAEAIVAWNRPVPAPAPEVGEKLAVTLYEAFWMRNAGIVAVAWDAQADAIRTMWRAIAADALADAAGPAKKGGE